MHVLLSQMYCIGLMIFFTCNVHAYVDQANPIYDIISLWKKTPIIQVIERTSILNIQDWFSNFGIELFKTFFIIVF